MKLNNINILLKMNSKSKLIKKLKNNSKKMKIKLL